MFFTPLYILLREGRSWHFSLAVAVLNGYLRRGYHQATNVTSYRTIAMRPCFLAALLLAMAVLCLTQAASHLQCTGSTVDVALGASYGVIITVVPDRCACCEGLLCNGH